MGRDGWHPAMGRTAFFSQELPHSSTTFDIHRGKISSSNFLSLEHDSFLHPDIKHFLMILTYPEFSKNVSTT